MNKEYQKLINDPFLNWLLVIACATLIFVFSSMSISEVKEVLPGVAAFPDYSLHFIEYFVLGLLTFRALFTSGYRKLTFLAAIMLGVLYGLSDELHQLFIGQRTFSLIDLFVDFFAVSVAQIGSLKRLYLK